MSMPDPETHFEIDPQALIDAHRAARAGGPQVLGYYHSHPAGEPEPSATDRAMAAGDGRMWAIMGRDECVSGGIRGEAFAALSYSRNLTCKERPCRRFLHRPFPPMLLGPVQDGGWQGGFCT